MDHDRLFKEKVVKLTNQWIEEGRREGFREASAQVLKQLIVRRFGAIKRSQNTRLAALPLQSLQALLDVILDLPDAAALDTWLLAQSPPK